MKSSPFLSFVSEFYFVTWWFLEGFGARAPLLVLEMFLVGSGCAFLYGFCIRYREFFPPFLGSDASLLFLSLPLLLLFLLLFWWPAWVPFLFLLLLVQQDDAGLPLYGQAGAARMVSFLFFLLCLPGSAAAPPSLPPSFCPLSLSLLSLACKHFPAQFQ